MKSSLIALPVLAALLFFCHASASTQLVQVPLQREIKFGLTPVLSEPQMRAEFEPLMSYLLHATGQRFTLYIAKDYSDLGAQMENGAVDIGSFSPFAYVEAARGGKIRLIAQSIIDGSATYRGVIITRKDSGIKSIADLQDKKFAFVDPKSASGYVYPKAMLIGKGINPRNFFRETMFAGSHDKVIAAVLNMRADAGAIYEGALDVAFRSGVPIGDLFVLATSEPIPHDAIAARVSLNEALTLQIQQALIDLDKTEEGKRVIAASKKKLTGYVKADDSVFNVVRRTAKIGSP